MKRDIASLTLAAEQQAFRDVLLSTGFGTSSPDYVRQDDGTLIDMFGFVLGSDGSLRNVNNFALQPRADLSLRHVAIDGLTVSMDIAHCLIRPMWIVVCLDAGTVIGRC